jgi:RNA polymerase sigma-70 factor (ECF subfamily)
MTVQTFEELIRRHGDRIFHFAFRLAGNRPDAENMVQEAFVRAYRKLDRYDPGGRFDAWVMENLNNVCLDSVRRCEHKREEA